jgi:uncharacterized protein (DUF2141 family)
MSARSSQFGRKALQYRDQSGRPACRAPLRDTEISEFSRIMLKFALPFAVAAAALTVPVAGARAASMGPDAAVCNAGNRPALLVNVSGFKNRSGRVRVQLYGGNPADFLQKGKKLRRIDLPVSAAGTMSICIAVPSPGTYAVAVRHDADGNNKSGWSDGGGFSNNPKISLLSLRPSHRQVAVSVGAGLRRVDVVLNYRSGLKIGPVGG